jgi:predicted nucleotidyltransferase
MNYQMQYPTKEHEKAAEEVTRFFTNNFRIDSVLLVNSCARGMATSDSCLDIAILVKPDLFEEQSGRFESAWERFQEKSEVIHDLKSIGKYSEVHLNFTDGVFTPPERDEVGGPDYFEVSIGNLLVFAHPLWNSSHYWEDLRQEWLPFYSEPLRKERLAMVRMYCVKDLNHIPLYIERNLFFQSFDRLYNAYRQFLQALFISRRTYPISYNKWIREQVEDILGLPELYQQITHLFEIRHFESREMIDKGKEIEELLEKFTNP